MILSSKLGQARYDQSAFALCRGLPDRRRNILVRHNIDSAALGISHSISTVQP